MKKMGFVLASNGLIAGGFLWWSLHFRTRERTVEVQHGIPLVGAQRQDRGSTPSTTPRVRGVALPFAGADRRGEGSEGVPEDTTMSARRPQVGRSRSWGNQDGERVSTSTAASFSRRCSVRDASSTVSQRNSWSMWPTGPGSSRQPAEQHQHGPDHGLGGSLR